MTRSWKGVVISEGLEEPSLINTFDVFDARISRDERDIGEGLKSRWHLYWVRAEYFQIERLKRTIKRGWYAHFWKDKTTVVIFRGKKFELVSNDRSTWKAAVDYGKGVGIPEDELDFPTE